MQRPYTIAAFAERAGSGDEARQSAPPPRRISRRDRLLVHLACWCRSRMSPVTAFFFDLAAHDVIDEVEAQCPPWRGVLHDEVTG